MGECELSDDRKARKGQVMCAKVKVLCWSGVETYTLGSSFWELSGEIFGAGRPSRQDDEDLPSMVAGKGEHIEKVV